MDTNYIVFQRVRNLLVSIVFPGHRSKTYYTFQNLMCKSMKLLFWNLKAIYYFYLSIFFARVKKECELIAGCTPPVTASHIVTDKPTNNTFQYQRIINLGGGGNNLGHKRMFSTQETYMGSVISRMLIMNCHISCLHL